MSDDISIFINKTFCVIEMMRLYILLYNINSVSLIRPLMELSSKIKVFLSNISSNKEFTELLRSSQVANKIEVQCIKYLHAHDILQKLSILERVSIDSNICSKKALKEIMQTYWIAG